LSKFKPSPGNSRYVRDREGARPKPRESKPSRAYGQTATLDPFNVAENVPASGGEAAEEYAANGFQKFGFYTALLFVFFRFSFVHEFITSNLHVNTHIIIILGGLSYLCALFSGQLFRSLQDKSTWLWTGFTCCMCLATVTSFWKGGSFSILVEYIETVFPVIFMIPALAVSKKQIQRMVEVIGVACIAAVILGTVNDDFKTGRMSIDAAGSDIQDPNDYAAHLILMMPALAYLTLRSGRSIVMKLIGIASLALCFLQILSTGSRGALVSLAITGLYIAMIGSKRVKLAILVGVPVLALITLPFVPSQSLTRLSTIFSSQAGIKDSEAVDSSQARLALLQASWKATLEHPLLGVGPGIFMDYQADSAKENGQRGMWHVTHNAYTQVSSECGFPALLFYLGAIGTTMFSLRKCARGGDKDLSVIAYFMTVMITGFSVCVFFLSLAYNVHILVLSALTVSLKLRLMADGKYDLARNGVAADPQAVPV
jgi:O-Antigen ligase